MRRDTPLQPPVSGEPTGNVENPVDLPDLVSLNSPDLMRTLGEANEAGLGGAGVWASDLLRIQQALNAQPKVTVFVPAHDNLPYEQVQINDLTFKIPFEELIEVPQGVAELVQARMATARAVANHALALK